MTPEHAKHSKWSDVYQRAIMAGLCRNVYTPNYREHLNFYHIICLQMRATLALIISCLMLICWVNCKFFLCVRLSGPSLQWISNQKSIYRNSGKYHSQRKFGERFIDSPKTTQKKNSNKFSRLSCVYALAMWTANMCQPTVNMRNVQQFWLAIVSTPISLSITSTILNFAFVLFGWAMNFGMPYIN